MRINRSVAIGAVAVLALALWGSAPASAAKPVKTFIPFASAGGIPPEGITLTGVCEFPVRVKNDLGNEFEKVFSDGRITYTGRVTGTLTNLDTGRSIDINTPVAAHLTPHADGSLTARLSGNVLIFFRPGELGPGDPGFIGLFSGQEFIEIGADGSQSFTQKGGTSEDVCSLLA